ncbi:MAG: hypothetical protein GY839_15450 [candidate division Zixibacteria bacterium]|nr:hypothetical protein [candidate division Zixibacteria bacterium]
MNHINEDKLLELALEISAGESERVEIETHVKNCPECREQLKAIQKDIEVIGSVRGHIALPKPAIHRKRPLTRAILKVAALFLFGFLTGLGISSWTNREPISVIPSYLKLSPPADSLTGRVVSDATQINREYYEQILND